MLPGRSGSRSSAVNQQSDGVCMASLGTRRRWLVAAFAAAAVAALVVGLPGPRSVRAQDPPPEPPSEAQIAQQLAADPDAPGPVQPIPFSHALHAGTYEIDCLYCHSGTERSQAAGVPSVETCMGCHLHVGQQLEGVQTLTKYWEEKRPIEWQQIHRLPEHVQFKHNRHLSDYAKSKGIDCQTCHGAVETMHKVYLVPDTKWWIYGLPTKKLEMGWCIKCHRENEASQDCLTCHY